MQNGLTVNRRKLLGLSLAAGLGSQITSTAMAQMPPDDLAQVGLVAGAVHGLILNAAVTSDLLAAPSAETFLKSLTELLQLGLITRSEFTLLQQGSHITAATDIAQGVVFPLDSGIPPLLLDLFPARADRSNLLTSPTFLQGQLHNLVGPLLTPGPTGQLTGSPVAIALGAIDLNSVQISVQLYSFTRFWKTAWADLQGAATGAKVGSTLGTAGAVAGAVAGAAIASYVATKTPK